MLPLSGHFPLRNRLFRRLKYNVNYIKEVQKVQETEMHFICFEDGIFCSNKRK